MHRKEAGTTPKFSLKVLLLSTAKLEIPLGSWKASVDATDLQFMANQQVDSRNHETYYTAWDISFWYNFFFRFLKFEATSILKGTVCPSRVKLPAASMHPVAGDRSGTRCGTLEDRAPKVEQTTRILRLTGVIVCNTIAITKNCPDSKYAYKGTVRNKGRVRRLHY